MRSHFRSGLRGEDMRVVRKQLRLTRWGMWAEAIARAFWPAFTVLCLVLAMALLGGFAVFGPVGHRILLTVAVLAFAASLVLGGMRLRRPTAEEITDRLDQTDRRRPLAALRDQLAVGRGSEPTEEVWDTHRARARKALASLTTRWPDLRLSSRDTWALRLLAPVLLIGAVIATGGDIGARIGASAVPQSLDPQSEVASYARDPAVEGWITPPAYTGLDTIYLESDPETGLASVSAPIGSELTVRVTDASTPPALTGGALAGIEGFTSLGGGLAEARGLLQDSGEMTVAVSGDGLATWQITVLPDAAPEIELEGLPLTTVTRALDLAFVARDDYGVAAAWAEIAPEGHDPDNARGLPLPVISFGLPLPLSGDMRDISDSAIRDFTSHPWAGAEVMLKLHAEDGAGQLGETEPVKITLPSRIFNHPLARALVEQRRDLAMNYESAGRSLDVLQAITRRPDALFGDNYGVYLTVRSAIRRLATGVGTETVPEIAPNVIDLLWQAALGLEDGDMSGALERLRQAQEALREALENGSDEDVRRAMEELRQAMNEYLQQLAQQQQQNPQQQGQQQQGQQMTQQDLQDMLDRMQQQSESGMRDEAREMLSELSRMLENLQAQQQQQGQSPGEQAMQELQDMIQRQRDLSDQTFDEMRQRRREEQLGRDGQQGQQPGQQQGQQQPGWGEGQGRGDEHGQQGQQGQDGREGQGQGQMQGQSPGSGGLAGEQERLRQELENLSRGLGSDQAAQALEDAVRSMGDARDDLQQGANSDAVRDQMDALDRLNEGAEALAQQMQEGQGDTRAQGNRRGEGGSGDTDQSDPFDRPTSSFGALDGRATRVPDRALIDRARELMQELRRRAAEPQRPQIELDYLDRLMDRF